MQANVFTVITNEDFGDKYDILQHFWLIVQGLDWLPLVSV